MITTAHTPWQALDGQIVVIDCVAPFVIVGRLRTEGSSYVELVEADVHDLRDTSTTREKYVLEIRRHGVRPNRQKVWVRASEIVAISRLEDVIDE
ncbi:MAG: hypothetical protein AB7U73_10215 [Pirellulales bacterium]